MSIIRIDRRFRGPPDCGNGGYFAGIVANALGGSDVVVTLKQPAPLDRDLTLQCTGDEAALYDEADLLAVAERRAVQVTVPQPPTLEAAREAEGRFKADRHIYPGCFVCGPDRAEGDGWRIFPGAVDGGMVAAPWQAPREFGNAEGILRTEFVWAALDCPGYFAIGDAAGLALLGRIGVRIEAPVPCGEPLVITGWAQGSDGRKHRAGTAIHDERGRLLAAANQLWVSV